MIDFTPEVSVIIPTFDRIQEIVFAIESVLKQNYLDFEVIVVDDASNVDIELFCRKKINDPRVRYIRMNKNGGAPAARNAGINKARGKYIAFLDSDDTWLPDKLAIQLTALKQAQEDILVSYTGYYQKTAQSLRSYLPSPTNNWYKKSLSHFDLSMGSTFLGKRIVFEKIGLLDEDLRRYEDPDWIIRYTKKYNFLLVNQPLTTVNLSSKSNPEIQETALKLFLEKRSLDMDVFGKQFGNKIRAIRWKEVAASYFLSGNPNKAKSLFLKSLSIYSYPQKPFGDYLMFIDSILGTNLFNSARKLKRRLIYVNKTNE
jgi:glycosyltransferase involved in cell wall biosynthesis